MTREQGPGQLGVTPSAAIKTYSQIVGDIVRTREVIATSLREGSLRCRARHTWSSQVRNLNDAIERPRRKREADKIKLTKEHSVPRDVWYESISWLEDVYAWDFRLNVLHVTTSRATSSRTFFSDVRLNNSDLKKIFLSTRDAKSLTWKNINKESWRSFWVLALKFATDDWSLIHRSTFSDTKNKDALERFWNILGPESVRNADLVDTKDKWIADYLRNRHPFSLGEDSVKAEVEFLMKTLREVSKK